MNVYDVNCGECHMPVEYGTCPYCGYDNQTEEDRESWPSYIVGAADAATASQAEAGAESPRDHGEPDPDLQAG